MHEYIVLVDENDNEVGFDEKYKVHKEGKLHRAFSIFVMNNKQELLLQKRAKSKYHSGGLWTNTCCSHATPNVDFQTTVHERLKFEMGLDCELKWIFKFKYQIELDNEMIENELDNVFLGFSDSAPTPNPNEVEDWKWINIHDLKRDIQENQHLYTYWLKFAFDMFYLSIA